MRAIPFVGSAALAVTVLLSSAVQAKAVAVMMNRTPAQQAMQADTIVVGKVTEIEKDLSKATQFPAAKDQVEYRVGVIKINENLQGAKGLTTIRVGWQNIQNPGPNGGPAPVGGPIRRPPFRGNPQPTLTAGQEGCFFLTKHHDGDFYVMVNFGQPLDKKAADFDKQLGSVKKIVKVIEDPITGLKAKDAGERQFNAALLIQKFRTYPPNAGPQPKQENVPAEVSSLIMRTMSEMEWGKFEQKEGIPLGVQNMFGMLGIQQGQHGFNPPKFVPNQKDYAKVYGDYVAKWIKDNADKYHIQKWAATK